MKILKELILKAPFFFSLKFDVPSINNLLKNMTILAFQFKSKGLKKIHFYILVPYLYRC